MDSNSFPHECTHLLALGDSKILYQLQLSHSCRGLRCKRVCDLSTSSSAGLFEYLQVHVCMCCDEEGELGRQKNALTEVLCKHELNL